jgi:predicted nucleic acid-binding protein/antitoxin (DNA-binding transcriptional repressor) of toxin-antitoxin stability system
MDTTINAKELRASLPKIVERVRRGERFTVLYRSRPALRLVPVSDDVLTEVPLEDDPLFGAGSRREVVRRLELGRSRPVALRQMTAKAAFVDTAGWMMLADAADPVHARARTFRDDWLKRGGVFVSTDFVLDETLTLLRMRLGIDAAEAWWNQVEGSGRLVWEWIDTQRAERARGWFFRWRDKAFSFTDCTSFVVMKERKLRTALTSDRHFEQAGFQIAPGVPKRR